MDLIFDIFTCFKGIYALAYKSFGFQAMYLFLRISHLQIPWTTTSFKDFAGVVFSHFGLGVNRSQLAVI